MSSHKKIIDCFLFYNEVELAIYRLQILWNLVDYFVISESKYTFMGKEKEYYTDDPRFDEYRRKMIIVRNVDIPFVSPDVTRREQWLNENNQRDTLQKAVESLIEKKAICKDDLVLLSDVDEIPDIETLQYLSKRCYTGNKITILKQKYHCYGLENIRNVDWYHVKMFSIDTWQKMNKLPFSVIRLFNVQIPFPHNNTMNIVLELMTRGGWHLSFFGTAEFVKNKLDNFSHQEIQLTEEEIVQHMQNCTDLSGNKSIVYNKVAVSKNNYLPPRSEMLVFG